MPSTTAVKSDGYSSISVKEAVRVAQSNNFMGLICTSQILVSVSATMPDATLPTTSSQDMAPALVEAIKVAGLVLVADTSAEVSGATRNGRPESSYTIPKGVDGVLEGNGVLRFSEAIDI